MEVITDNFPAIHTYEKIGFEKTKRYICFRQKDSIPKNRCKIPIHIRKVDGPNWDIYDVFYSANPAWQNSRKAIVRTLASETFLEVDHKTQTVGYAAFNSHSGRISQIGVHPAFRGLNIGNNLLRSMQELSYDKKLSILNIESSDQTGVSFFQHNGFEVAVEQFEMIWKI